MDLRDKTSNSTMLNNPNIQRVIIIIIAAVILLFPYLLGDVQNDIIGAESAENLTKSGTIYLFILSAITSTLGELTGGRMLAFFIGLFSVWMFDLILLKHKVEDHKRFAILGLYIVSPIFIYTNTIYTHLGLFILLLMISYQYIDKMFGYISLITCLFFGFWESIITLLLLSLFCYKEKSKQSLIFLAIFFLVFILRPIDATPLLYYGTTIIDQFAIFGGLLSVSLFAIILAAYGIVITVPKDFRTVPYYIVGLCFLILTFFAFDGTKAILNLAIAIYGGIGFHTLFKRNWTLLTVRSLTLLVLVLGLLFSCISFASYLSTLTPTENEREIFDVLNRHPQGTLLADDELGSWIRYYTIQTPYLNSRNQADLLIQSRIETTTTLFSLHDLDEITQSLSEMDINYILITKEEEIDKDFLFVLENSNQFKLLLNREETLLYQVSQQS